MAVSLSSTTASSFMSIVSEDLLLEILLRLPDAKTVIRCILVSKRWYSLLKNSDYFIRRFIEYHSPKQRLEFSTVFNYSLENVGPFYQILPQRIPHPYDLSFLPDSGNLEIKASCDDLLLVARSKWHYYICNHLTKEWLALPEVPPTRNFKPNVKTFNLIGSYGFALARNSQSYRVVLVNFSFFFEFNLHLRVTIFDPQTALWSQVSFYIPARWDGGKNNIKPAEFVVTSDGVINWLDGVEVFHGLVTFDPFQSRLRLIDLPSGQFDAICPCFVREKVRLGVVRGRLRVSRMLPIGGTSFGLRVWEFDSSDDSWLLVHDVVLKISVDDDGDDDDDNNMMFFVYAFDPTDGNVIFVVRDTDILRYEFDRNEYERVCEFPSSGESIDDMKKGVARDLKVLVLVRPLWPTSISSLSYTHSM